MDCAIRYATERKAFDKPIASLQLIQSKLADMEVRIESARLLTWKAAALKDSGKNYTKVGEIVIRPLRKRGVHLENRAST